MTTILIGGDLCPIGDNVPLFTSGDADSLFGGLLQDFRRADLVVANLECPLIERRTPIPKTGPVFGAASAAINGIRAAGIDVLGLANNHILDHGWPGLENTMAVCARAGIATVGAGSTLGEARQILVRKLGDLRVGVLAMAEHEFSIAAANSPGANPLDLIDYVRNVASARDTFDYLIVLLHGGPEFLTAPSPRLKKTCHFLVEMGANAVIVQHPHALGGYECYRGAHIVYGQGALLMDEAVYRNDRGFHEAVLVVLTVEHGRSSMELVPIVQSDPAPGARPMTGERADRFLRDLAAKSRAILDDEYVSHEWRRFCEEQKHAYLSVLVGHNRLVRLANRHGRLARLLYRRQRLLGTRNVVCCETHREALETIFKAGVL
ncbi:MAG TPA: CapA family protein [Vicinamibacterales bacterium]|nr:CapA family protein [Vicinamibacterales bacterium]